MTERVPEHVCLLTHVHASHLWWYTSYGGGHMLEDPISASDHEYEKDLKQWSCPGIVDQSYEDIEREATEFVNGELDRILPIIEDQIIGCHADDYVSLKVGDAFLIAEVIKAERMFDGIVMKTPAADSPKMLRETLCAAQSAVLGLRSEDPRTPDHVARLQRLIDEVDTQRPLGADGKHGNRHTPTCGCEDAPATDHPDVRENVRVRIRPSLTAAAPLIAAEAWDKGFTAGRPIEHIGGSRPSREDNPYRTCNLD